MKFTIKDPPRVFTVRSFANGQDTGIKIKDCAQILLVADEQVTFVTATGGEYDVARKEWGFYATPSLNGRLAGFGLRAVLVKHQITKRFYLLLVESGKEKGFECYIQKEGHKIICWMDSNEALENLEKKLKEIQK